MILAQRVRTPAAFLAVGPGSHFPYRFFAIHWVFFFCFDSSSFSTSCSSRGPSGNQATFETPKAGPKSPRPPSLLDILRELRYMGNLDVLTLSMSMSPSRCHLVYASLIPLFSAVPFGWKVSKLNDQFGHYLHSYELD